MHDGNRTMMRLLPPSLSCNLATTKISRFTNTERTRYLTSSDQPIIFPLISNQTSHIIFKASGKNNTQDHYEQEYDKMIYPITSTGHTSLSFRFEDHRPAAPRTVSLHDGSPPALVLLPLTPSQTQNTPWQRTANNKNMEGMIPYAGPNGRFFTQPTITIANV
jgi:hypothetical protein